MFFSAASTIDVVQNQERERGSCMEKKESSSTAVTGFDARKGWLWSLGSMLGFTGTNLLDKAGLTAQGGNPYGGIISKQFIPWLIAVVVSLLGGKYIQLNASSPKYVGRKAWLPILIAGPITEAIGTVLFYFGITYGGIVIAVPAVQSQILWTALIAFFLLRDPLNPKIAIGALLFVGGLVVLSLGQLQGIPVSPQWGLGLLLSLIGGVCWATGATLWRVAITRGLDRWVLVSLYYPSAWVVLFLFLLFTGQLGTAFAISGTSILYFAASGITAELVGALFLMTAFKYIPAAMGNGIKSTYTAFVAILAALIFKETLNWIMMVGIVVMVVGLWLLTYFQSTVAKQRKEAVTATSAA
jgi:drug/metabolite transporter (DMT)-like permease